MAYPNYDPGSSLTPLTAAELDGLDGLLQGFFEHDAMSLDGLDGYLTALLVLPPEVMGTLPSDEWLPLIWGGDTEPDPAPFQSRRQRKATVVLVLRHLRHLAEQLEKTPQDWEPIFSIAEQGADEWVDARDWCTGFLQAVDLLPSAWDGVIDTTTAEPIVALGGGIGPKTAPGADTEDRAICDALSRAVPEAVLELKAAPKAAVPPPPRGG